MTIILPNLPKFSPARILHNMVTVVPVLISLDIFKLCCVQYIELAIIENVKVALNQLYETLQLRCLY